jgi:hypothetical protein
MFVYILQLEIEQFSPDDSLFGRLSKESILPVVAHQLDALQATKCPLKPLMSVRRSDVHLVSRECCREDLGLPVH